MKRFLLIAVLSGALALPATATLKEGDAAPDFAALASIAGKTFTLSLSETLRKGPAVVYFYPSAFTGGCNIQAHSFSVNQEKFATAGATVIGVSLDSIARLSKFSADPEYCAGKFAVVSDVGGTIAKSFDLAVTATPSGKLDTRGIEIDHDRVERTTFVVTREGKIAAVIGGLAPQDNVVAALDVVEKLANERR